MEQTQSLFPSIIDKGQRLHIKIPSIRHSQLNFEVWFSILESWLGAKCKKKSHFLEKKKKSLRTKGPADECSHDSGLWQQYRPGSDSWL